MRGQLLIDTSAIVSILSERDQHHDTCRKLLDSFTPPLITSWAVITEAQWLLRKTPLAVGKLFDGLEGGLWTVAPMPTSCYQWLRVFLEKYSDIGAQLADATLVYLAETLGIETIFTLDNRDFQIYRTSSQRSLAIVPELG